MLFTTSLTASLSAGVTKNNQQAYLLLELLSVGGAICGSQVEWAMCRVTEALQLLLLVSLLCSLYGPLLLGGALMRSWGWL